MPTHPAISDSVLGSAFERSHDAQLLVDDDRCVVAANASAAALLGHAAQQLLGSRFDDLVSDGDAERWTARWPRLVARGGGRGRVALRAARRPARGGAFPRLRPGAAPGGGCHPRSTHNRRRFEEELHRATRLAERHGHHGALLLLDVDDFKAVNDTWGHGGGDKLLRALAQVLAGSIRDSDIPARLGGDEFALLLPRVDAPDAGRAAAAKLDGAVRAALETWAATASIGVAGFGRDDRDAERVLATADEALYRAKAVKGERPAPGQAADGPARPA